MILEDMKVRENKIDGITLKECMLAAAGTLEANKKQLNDLNVFPGAGWRYRHKYVDDDEVGFEGSTKRNRY